MPIGTITRHSKEVIEKALSLRHQGEALKDVVEITGVSKNVICNIIFKRIIYQDVFESFLEKEQLTYDEFLVKIKRHNKKRFRTKANQQSLKQRKLSKEEVFHIFDCIFEKDMKIQDIANEIEKATIYDIQNIRYKYTYSDFLDDYFNEKEIMNRTPYYQKLNQSPHHKRKVNEESIRILFASYLSGNSIEKASAEAGFSSNTAKDIFNARHEKWRPFILLLMANEGFTKKSFAEYRKRKNRKIHRRNALKSPLIQSWGKR